MIGPRVIALSLLLTACGASTPAVALVDTQRALLETHGGVAARDRLGAMYRQRQSELDTRQAQLREEQTRIEAQEAQHVDQTEARTHWQAALTALQSEYAQDQQDLSAAEQQMAREMVERLRTLAGELAASHGVELVLERGADGANLVWASSHVLDLTDALISLYDQRYPSTASAAPTTAPTQVLH
jgi:Skp family chaperone for outer membrane proteins